MNIIRQNFTNKKQTKITLKELSHLNFIIIKKYERKTLYTPNMMYIQDKISKCKNQKIIKDILNILPDKYLITAVMYNVSFDFFCLDTIIFIHKF